MSTTPGSTKSKSKTFQKGHPPMYVHQLQNLTYALTGEELKRKELYEKGIEE